MQNTNPYQDQVCPTCRELYVEARCPKCFRSPMFFCPSISHYIEVQLCAGYDLCPWAKGIERERCER